MATNININMHLANFYIIVLLISILFRIIEPRNCCYLTIVIYFKIKCGKIIINRCPVTFIFTINICKFNIIAICRFQITISIIINQSICNCFFCINLVKLCYCKITIEKLSLSKFFVFRPIKMIQIICISIIHFKNIIC